MPNFKKPNNNKFEPRNGAPAGGSRSAGHRGYKADAAAPAKKRWNADDRAARTGDRPASTDRRPDWTPRENRPAYGDRPQRGAYGDRPNRTERPSYGDRPARTERPSYNDRPARPAGGERTER